MNPFDIEQEPMHFNKKFVIGLLACFLIFVLILFGASFGSNGTEEPVETSISMETTTVESTTVPETYEQTSEEITDCVIELPVATIPGYSSPADTTTIETTEADTYVPEITVTEETAASVDEIVDYVVLDETEKLIFATLVAYECGGGISSYETKLAVASVVVNRMKMWDDSLRDVIFATNQFSPAQLINKKTGANYYWSNGKKCTKNMERGGPYEECWLAVEEVCANGPSIPTYVIYFRSGHYHSWDTLVSYAKIGGLYFSYAPSQTKVCSNCTERFTKTEFKTHKVECTTNN